MSIWDWLDKIDKNIFRTIHSDGAIPSLDSIISQLRNPYTWIPLYAFIIFWLFRYHRQYAWQFIFLSLICFSITDLVSAKVLKPVISRLRPCYDQDLVTIIRNLIPCGGKDSMPSTHASNHFGLAAFWFFSVQLISSRKWFWLFIWALLIGYAQVYVGKHYPFDIVAGAVFGLLIGLLITIIFKRWCFP
jgi:membrane-associated phospholipid phosphatase